MWDETDDQMLREDRVLREKARAEITAGRLPNCPPERISGGRGFEGPCAICGVSLGVDELGFQIGFGIGPGLHREDHIVHIRCLWVLECETGTPGLHKEMPVPGEQAAGER